MIAATHARRAKLLTHERLATWTHLLARRSPDALDQCLQIEGAEATARALAATELNDPEVRLVRALVALLPPRAGDPDIALVLDAVAQVHGITVAQLVASDRRPRATVPRHAAAYLLRADAKCSLVEIAHALRRDHTTILYAVTKVAAQITLASDGVYRLAETRALITGVTTDG